MNSQKAIIIGATGLTGSHLLKTLLDDKRFSLVKIFVRKSTGITHPKLEEHVINFDNYSQWKFMVTGDVLFSALGTTIKKAGGRDAQYKVDYSYQYQFAVAAAENHVPVYVLVSSASANPKSPFFYMRMKGELERDVKKLNFDHIHILQPGLLTGERKEERLGETIGLKVVKFLNKVGLVRNMTPIHGRCLAQAMINISFQATFKIQTYTLADIFRYAARA